MFVKSMTEKEIHVIGHAFGYYDYGRETAEYICAYVRVMLQGGLLHTTSGRGEG